MWLINDKDDPKFDEKDDSFQFKIRCARFSKAIIFKPWNKIVDKAQRNTELGAKRKKERQT
jgi:hypothetical protein